MIRILLCVLVLFATPAITFAQDGAEISTSVDGPTDFQINVRLRELFAAVDTLTAVRSNTSAGIVTLSGTVKDNAEIDRAIELANRVEGVVSVSSQIQVVTTVNERLTSISERFEARVDQAIILLPLLVVALLAFVAITAFGLWIARRDWPWNKIAPNAFIADLLRQIVRLAFIGLAIVLALDILGATAVLSTVLGAAGIVGLAVGFAVRDTVENYIASILLSIRQPFQPNDAVRIGDQEGVVVMLTSRATVLMSYDGNHIRIPNATVFKGIITNFTRNADRRFAFTIGIDPSASLAEAREIGLKILTELEFTLADPGPDSWIDDIGDSAVVMTFVAWVDQRKTSFGKARSESIRLVKLALEGAGIALPEPGYRVQLQGIPGAPAIGLTETEPTSPPDPREIAPDEMSVIDTDAEDGIERKADAEREAAGDDNLLRDDADQEMGGKGNA